ncbi:MAG TPA: DUF3347 domain-containing protein [Puia sp.]|nr:DUF3347 domain-containing protein [Puia sp.]
MKKRIYFTYLLCGLGLIPAAAQNSVYKDLNQVIAQYLSVKDALAAGDGNLALSHAKALLAAVKAVSPEKLPDAGRKFWQSYEPRLEYDSRHISEVNRVEHQREHFASLSANLYAVLRVFPFNDNTLYEEYCSMSKRTFLSQASDGKDPYMGMTTCNKVTAIIAPHSH